MRLTDEYIRLLAQLERDMDSGVQLFVRMDGARVAVSAADLQWWGLEAGQSITWEIFRAITEARLEDCQRELAYQEFLKTEGLD